MKRMYLVNSRHPYNKIEEVEVEIKSCKKRVWAILPDGSRKAIGCYIFQTLESAERAQYALVKTLTRIRTLAFIAPYTWKQANDFIHDRVLH